MGREPVRWPEFSCHRCRYDWVQESWLDLGETFHRTGSLYDGHVTKTDLEWLPAARARLIQAAAQEATITYSKLKAEVGFAHPTHGVGRLLDLITIECGRRGEPSLAVIPVNAATGEVGYLDWRDVKDVRRQVFERWSLLEREYSPPSSAS